MRWLIPFVCGLVVTALQVSYAEWQWLNPRTTSNTLYDVTFVSEHEAIAVGQHGTVLRSMDDGETWQIVQTQKAEDFVHVSFANADTGWVVAKTRDSTYVSQTANGGASWQYLNTLGRQEVVDFQFVSSDTGFVAVSSYDASEVRKSVDGGVEWSESVAFSQAITRLQFLNSQLGWALLRDSTLMRTEDGGASWDSLALPHGRQTKNLFFLDSDNGWYLNRFDSGHSGVYRTRDGGNTWSVLDTAIADVWTRKIVFADSLRGWITTENSSDAGLWLTVDGGESFTETTWSAAFPVQAVTSAPSGEFVGVGSIGLLLKSGADEIEPVRLDRTITDHLGSVVFVSPQVGWVSGANGLIMKTEDGGLNWTVQPTGTTESFRDLFMFDELQGWACGQNGVIVGTHDGGEHWDVQTSGVSVPLGGLSFVSSMVGWCSGWDGTILHTEDGGETWTPQQSGTTWPLGDIAFINESYGWAVGGQYTNPDRGVIVRTTNGGETWEIQEGGDGNTYFQSMYRIQFENETDGWIIGGSWQIDPPNPHALCYATHDGGETWNSGGLGGSTTDQPTTAIGIDSVGNRWVAGAGPKFWKSSPETGWFVDNDLTWLTGTYMTGMSFVGTKGWMVGPYGGILYNDQTVSAIEPRNAPVATEFSLSAYPNPFNSTVSLRFDLTRGAVVSLRIYDVTGRLVETLADEWISAGTHTLHWNAQTASGVYFARVVSGEQVSTRNLLLLK
ncbi:MAG: T9SS type A sorting domain-containing protein [Calditrichaeota bacterium]|nr:T9SS type A sorting domain-containing protein [Calditrichota bacterium]MCB9369444.1 T9SS type A sorting domain-containing protein [Calditrichota bacterium]